MNRRQLTCSIAAITVLLTGATPAFAQDGADVNISPKRVTFDRNRRSATVYIYNQGNAAGTFDIGLIDRAMLPDGQIVATNDPAAAKPEIKPIVDQLKSAHDMLLVSPRRATLAPGQGQTIRLRLSNLPDVQSGEFRTHLTVTTIPPPNTGVTVSSSSGSEARASGSNTRRRAQSAPATSRR